MLAILHLRFSQKLLLQSLSNKLDVCKRGSSFLLFAVAQFLVQICQRVKANLFSGRMTVVNLRTEVVTSIFWHFA